ncbi:protein mono-ADP-ribosyltransferase PARP4 [Pelomyxa schiedti]|nr:protein mono-ADP-ribosyltransferase PARP4 [Pelomyxa schiedti]
MPSRLKPNRPVVVVKRFQPRTLWNKPPPRPRPQLAPPGGGLRDHLVQRAKLSCNEAAAWDTNLPPPPELQDVVCDPPVVEPGPVGPPPVSVPLDPTAHVIRDDMHQISEFEGNASLGTWAHRVVREYEANSIDAPYFPQTYFVVRRDLLSKFFVKRSSLLLMELHIGVDGQARFFRIVTLKGTMEQLDKNISKPYHMYVHSWTDAVAVYGSLFREKTTKNKYQKVLLSSANIGNTTASASIVPAAVRKLLIGLWKESAIQLCSKNISLKQLSSPQIEKAAVVLRKIQQAIENGELDPTVAHQLTTEFFSFVPTASNMQNDISTIEQVLSWMDTLQDMRDVSCIGEGSFNLTGNLGDVDLLYYSLGATIELLPSETLEYSNVLDLVAQHAPHLSVSNVFKVSRQMDLSNFNSDIGNERLLFHGSAIGNWLGILSRGMLLPHTVTTTLGVKRTNAGNLGAGLYFSDDPLTALKYTTGDENGNRYLLLSRVALGNVKDLHKYDFSLTAPPPSFNSCRGVKAIPGVKSEFDDDEYVIYTTAQQHVQYLLEISGFKPENPKQQDNTLLSSILSGIKKRVIVDSSNIPAAKPELPASKEKGGLVSSTGQPIPLEAISIHAKLIDLVGEVVILQEFHNTSATPIEAKYVFPLDEKSAVVGFEAFINHKHVIGVVKEKEQAHKEYKEAIKRGDGAYLLDEAKSNVFTVSVGNLPPHTKVVIKISYITELGIEAMARKFLCPVNLVGQLKHSALAPITQHNTSTISVTEHRGPFSMEIAINMPHVIHEIESPTHSIRFKQTPRKATLFWIDEPPSSDFILLVRMCDSHTPFMWVEKAPQLDALTPTKSNNTIPPNEEYVAMVALYPTLSESVDSNTEYILLIDQSASMGPCLLECKQVSLNLLWGVPMMSRFNVITFGSTFEALFLTSVVKTSETQSIAHNHIMQLQANWGGSMLWPALKSVLLEIECTRDSNDAQQRSTNYNLFIISDGDIANDLQVMKSILDHCQDPHSKTRVFSLGVGTEVHRHNLMSFARLGGGACEFVSKSNPLRGQVQSQISRSKQACLKDIAIKWGSGSASSATIFPSVARQAPQKVMSLFSGDRVIVYSFINADCHGVTLQGKESDTGAQFLTTVTSSIGDTVNGLTLHRLCARAIVRDWEESSLAEDNVSSELAREKRKGEIIDLGVRYSLATTLTSFIAVEERTEAEKRGEVQMKPTPPIATLDKAESVDEIPFCTNWKEIKKVHYNTTVSVVSSRKMYPKAYHHTEFDYWAPGKKTKKSRKVSTSNPHWQISGSTTADTRSSSWGGGKKKYKQRRKSSSSSSGSASDSSDSECEEEDDYMEFRRAPGAPRGLSKMKEEAGMCDVKREYKAKKKSKCEEKCDYSPKCDMKCDMKCDIKCEEAPKSNAKGRGKAGSAMNQKKDMARSIPVPAACAAASPAPPKPSPAPQSQPQPKPQAQPTPTPSHMPPPSESAPPPPPSGSAAAAPPPPPPQCSTTTSSSSSVMDDLQEQSAKIESISKRAALFCDEYDPTIEDSYYSPESLSLHTQAMSYKCSAKKAKRGGCFIATAAYGSPLDPRINTLRRFRDTTLHNHYLGRKFIDLYYATSPPFALWLTHHPLARYCVRLLLLPLVYLFELLGYNQTPTGLSVPRQSLWGLHMTVALWVVSLAVVLAFVWM